MAIFPIRFNAQNVMSNAVGDYGLAPSDFDPKIAGDVVNAFRSRVDSGEVGFPNLPLDTNTIKSIEKYASSMRGDFESVLVLGIGGSALGPYALDTAMRGPHPVQTLGKKQPGLFVMDNVDPGFVSAFLEKLNPKKTFVVVIAKSGGTAETISTFMIVHEWLVKAVGGKKTAQRIAAVTDAHKGDLLAIAQQEKYKLFFVPAEVGGRFSVFTPVGLLPAALIGLDIRKMMQGAGDANAVAWSRKFDENPAVQSAMVHHGLDTKRGKKVEIVFAYSAYLWGAAFWYRQLWAESLGKRIDRRGMVVNTGQTPVAALGVTDQHSQVQLYVEGPHDKMLTFWAVERDREDIKIPSNKSFTKFDAATYLQGKKLSQLFHSERVATEAALTEAGRPNCRWTMPKVDEYHIGAFFQLLEFQTAFCGELYGINAFDQPGVELAKKITNGLMGRKGYEDWGQKYGKKK